MVPSWVEGFLASRRRRGVDESTVGFYRTMLKLITNHHHLDLEHCSEPELLKGLDEMREGHSKSYFGHFATTVRAGLVFLDREDLAEKVEHPKRDDRATTIKEKLLTDQEIERLIQEAPTLTDRLIVELLVETWARRGELVSLKVKSVQFDEYGAILTLTGKTGTRRRRVYSAVPDLRTYLNNHPQRDQPDTPLLLNSYGRAFSNFALYRRIRMMGERILHKRIHPHMFRHTGATAGSKLFTDREMMLLGGWHDADSVGVYSHLSMRDVDEKDLVLHGLKRKEEILRPIMQTRRCMRCQEENAPIAVYCVKCGAVLTGTESVEQLQQQIDTLKGQFETILKTKITKET